MIPLVWTSLAVALALSQTPTPAKPDFSGTWQIDRTRSESAGAITLTIRQTATAVSVQTTRGDKTWEVTYPFDPSRKPEAAGSTTSRPVAYWDGTKLVTEGLTDVQGQTVSTKATRSLNAAGSEMTVESVVIVQHGYSSGAQNYATAKDVFTRSRLLHVLHDFMADLVSPRACCVGRCAFRNRPVWDTLHAAISSGRPVATISPPA